ncbi:MAG: LysR family transcriptional regulator [Alphaproteobacteria bacterium]|nr:LysR family transcriptional regulator [Alphaproteobacteria bacterium SS10]
MPFRRLPPLSSLRAFEAAARLGSFKEAAAELSVTPAAISQQIKTLEEDLQVNLFNRGARAVSLTPDGAKLSQGLSQAFFQMRDTVEQLLQSQSPELAIATSPAIASKWLSRRIHKFSEQYPELTPQIMAHYDVVPLGDGGPSVAVRCGREPGEELYFRKLCSELVLPLASPGLVQQLDLEKPADIMRAPLIHDLSHSHVVATMPTWDDWFAEVGLDPRNAGHGTRFVGAADLALNAAISGAGVLLGRLGLAIDDIRAGLLVCPFGPVLETGSDYYVVCPREFADRECLQTFMNWLEGESAENLRIRDEFLAGIVAS